MSPIMETQCCEAPPELMQVGGELYVRCSVCHKYIGHVVDRQIALLYSMYDSLIEKAVEKEGKTLEDYDMPKVYDRYCEALLKYAPHAAWKALKGD